MAEVNTLTGKITEPTQAPTPASPGAPAEKEPAQQGGNQEAAFRRLQQKLRAGEAELQSLRERVAHMEGVNQAGQATAPAQATAPKGWGDLTDAQLDQAISHGISETKPEQVTAAMNEKIARATAKAAEAAKGVSTAEYRREQVKDSIRSSIDREFGPDATNEESPLFQAADRHYARFIAMHGKDAVIQNPEWTRQAFINADRELHAGERDRLKTLEQEHEKLKRQMALEHGGVHPGVPRSQESADALAKGDLRGAIRGLNLAKGLKAEIERRYR
jgi:hypothetical protein